ncbi:MAG TPA: DUF2865 domain-containing protein [Xanthobacteraceae bacterium]|nr:DUF2865 domain-containing protein [Xanthobacteraceae bacterium]
MRRIPLILKTNAALLVAVSTFAVVTPAPANAEGGFFGAIIHSLRRAIAPWHHYEREALPDPILEMRGEGRSERRSTHASEESGGTHVAYCVRTCDGRYFPIAKNESVTPAKMCQSMCPAAKTEIFSGSTISNAVSEKGAKYTSLASAFLYRDKLVDGCSCNKKRELGTASISYMNDPTLRSGDIVMTVNGPVVFKGDAGPTHKASDFVPVEDSKRISSRTKKQVIALKVLPTPQTQAAQRARSAKEAAAEFGKRAEAKGHALGYTD